MPAPPPGLFAFGPLFGREEESAELRARLCEARLVTVCGPGGVGKTRLVVELLRDPPQPAVCVALDDVRQAAAVPERVAAALAIEPSPADDAAAVAERVAAALAARGPTLLVLDNLEQIADAADWLRGWLIGCPTLTVLATSRRPLRLAAESVLMLEPLPLGPDGPAERLFRHRARAAGARLGDDAPGLDALLRWLDGLPLAIELAAARATLLPPAALLDQLEAGRLGLGRERSRDRPPRQADLTRCFEWSWALLDDKKRRALTACAVFGSAFDADAARAVVGPDALDQLGALLDHSLLQVRPDAHFDLLSALRSFVRGAAEPSTLAEARARHRRFAIDVGGAHAEQAHGAHGEAARTWLRAHRADLAAALRDALDGGHDADVAAALRALRPLCYLAAAPAGFEALLDRAVSVRDPAAAGWALCVRGEWARLQGRLLAAERDLAQAAAVGGDARLAATSRAELGIVAHERGDLAAAAEHHAAALACWRAVGDARGVGRALGSQAVTLHASGELHAARDHYEQAIDLLAEVGDRRSQAIFTSNLGDLHIESARLGEARACYEEAREGLLATGDRRIAAAVTGNLGGVLLAEGRVAEATLRRQEAVEALQAAGDARLAAVFRGYLGLCRHAGGDLVGAADDYAAAEQVLTARGDRRHAGLFAAHRAAALAARGEAEAARAAMAEAERAVRPVDEPVVRAVLALQRGQLDLAAGDRISAAARLAAARDDSEDLVVARRLLRAALGDGEAPAPALRLVVRRDGAAAHAPGGERLDLSRRPTLGRLLAALVDIRLRSPGAGLDLAALQAAAWPGERMSPSSGANRVYVAISTLRAQGLADVLQKRQGGYLLDPDLPIVLDDDL